MSSPPLSPINRVGILPRASPTLGCGGLRRSLGRYIHGCPGGWWWAGLREGRGPRTGALCCPGSGPPCPCPAVWAAPWGAQGSLECLPCREVRCSVSGQRRPVSRGPDGGGWQLAGVVGQRRGWWDAQGTPGAGDGWGTRPEGRAVEGSQGGLEDLGREDHRVRVGVQAPLLSQHLSLQSDVTASLEESSALAVPAS